MSYRQVFHDPRERRPDFISSDVCLLARGSSYFDQRIRITDRRFFYLNAEWVKRVIGRFHVLPETVRLL